MDRDQLQEMLKQGIYDVTFTKVNGETRTMPCTLMEGVIPPARKDDPVSQKRVRDINPQVMVAWCIDKREWRSFRVANVISMVKHQEDVDD